MYVLIELSSFSQSSSINKSFSVNSSGIIPLWPLAFSSSRILLLNLVWRKLHRSLTPRLSFRLKFGYCTLFNRSTIPSQTFPRSGLPFIWVNKSLAIISLRKSTSCSSVHSITLTDIQRNKQTSLVYWISACYKVEPTREIAVRQILALADKTWSERTNELTSQTNWEFFILSLKNS